MKKIRIAIVEDQQLFRQSLSVLIKSVSNFDLMLEAADAESFLEALKTIPELPYILLLDVNLPVINGIELNAILNRLYPSIKVIALSVHTQEKLIARMIHAGASGYLNKNCDVDELILAINTVYSHDFYLNAQVLQVLRNAPRQESRSLKNIDSVPIELTGRETQILQLICKELSNTEISEKLFISVRTVEGHRNNLLQKTGCRNTAGLVLFAVRYGIIDMLL